MRKFSEINKVNEEFFLSKKKDEVSIIKPIKISIRQMESYCKSLLNEEFIMVQPVEKGNFNFTYYKIKSISKTGTRKFDVVMETFDNTKKMVGELSYNLEV